MLYPTGIQEILKTIESNILLAKDRDALDYRSTQMAQCSMTGLAAALVAQVASSSLQLQYMPTIHWIIPGLCTTSLVIGLLCVHYSFLLHYSLAKCGCARDLRTAFSTRKGTPPVGAGGDFAVGGPGGGEGREERGEREWGDEGLQGTGVGTAEQVEAGRGTKLPSYKAALILWLPIYLLILAILLYIAAIGLYWAIAGAMDLQGSRGRSWKVGFNVLKTSLVSQVDNEILDLRIHHASIVGDFISMGGGNRGIGGLSSLRSGAVRQP